MTADPFTPEQAAKLAAFDAAPLLPESSDLVRAMLALAASWEDGMRAMGYADGHHEGAAVIRATVAAVLAADPEPRDAVIERMARAMWSTDDWKPWADVSERGREFWRRLAAAALDASRGGTQ